MHRAAPEDFGIDPEIILRKIVARWIGRNPIARFIPQFVGKLGIRRHKIGNLCGRTVTRPEDTKVVPDRLSIDIGKCPRADGQAIERGLLILKPKVELDDISGPAIQRPGGQKRHFALLESLVHGFQLQTASAPFDVRLTEALLTGRTCAAGRWIRVNLQADAAERITFHREYYIVVALLKLGVGHFQLARVDCLGQGPRRIDRALAICAATQQPNG